jgi:hypothetical protein
MAVWAAILIGLGGGVIGTLLSISHQRGAEFRTRQLDAAANFLESAEALRRAARNPGGRSVAANRAIFADRWDELVPRVMLVELLFDDGSRTTYAARLAGSAFREVLDAIDRYGGSGDEEELGAIAPAIDEASEALQMFTAAAPHDVRALPPVRAWRRLRFAAENRRHARLASRPGSSDEPSS